MVGAHKIRHDFQHGPKLQESSFTLPKRNHIEHPV
jgi:hypothetical protein